MHAQIMLDHGALNHYYHKCIINSYNLAALIMTLGKVIWLAVAKYVTAVLKSIILYDFHCFAKRWGTLQKILNSTQHLKDLMIIIALLCIICLVQHHRNVWEARQGLGGAKPFFTTPQIHLSNMVADHDLWMHFVINVP